MKKAMIFAAVLAAFMLCGCGGDKEETMTLDYEQMDREFGQLKEQEEEPKEEEESGFFEFSDEIEAITNATKEYAAFLVSGDARGCAKAFPNEFIAAIMNQEGVTWDEAVELSSGQILITFGENEKELSLVKSQTGEFGYAVSLKNLTRFKQESALIKMYKTYGITVFDVVEVDFEISSGEEVASAYIRLVKTQNGEWKTDMSYFEI